MKIKEKLKFENILIIYILIQPIIDMITSVCVRNISPSLSLGILVRMVFLLYLMIYTIITVDIKSRKKILIYYACIAIYAIGYLINCYMQNGLSMIVTQIKGFIKTFYFPIVLISFNFIFKQKKYSKNEKYFSIALFIYTACIACGKIFSFGYETYQYKENLGTIGLFFAGNETGAILALIAPICFYMFANKKFNIFTTLLCVLTIYSMLEIGTKVAFCAIMSLILLTNIYLLVKVIKKSEVRPYKQFISIIIITLITILFLGYTSVGQNLNVPKLVIPKPVEQKVENVVENKVENKATNKTTKKKKKTTTTKKTTENTETPKKEVSILSGRDTYFKDTINDYKETSVAEKLLGMGYLSKDEKGNVFEKKLIEIDYFDIYFCHGIVGIIVYIIPCLGIAIEFIKKIVSNRKDKIKNNLSILTLYSVLIGFGIALMAGHVFTAPAVSLFLALNIMALYKEVDVEK